MVNNNDWYFDLLRTLITAARDGNKELYDETKIWIQFYSNHDHAKEFFRVLGDIGMNATKGKTVTKKDRVSVELIQEILFDRKDIINKTLGKLMLLNTKDYWSANEIDYVEKLVKRYLKKDMSDNTDVKKGTQILYKGMTEK